MNSGLTIYPDQIMGPFIEAAVQVLLELDSTDVPKSIRRLKSFEPHHLNSETARRQLIAALESDGDFRGLVDAWICELPESVAFLNDWNPSLALSIVTAAADGARLGNLSAALLGARPDGWEYAMGILVARSEFPQSARSQPTSNKQESHTEHAALARAETSLQGAQEEIKHLKADLKEERRSRRAKVAAADKKSKRSDALAKERADKLASAHDALKAADVRAEETHKHLLEKDVEILKLHQALASDNPPRERVLVHEISTNVPTPTSRKVGTATKATKKKRRVAVQVPPGLRLDDPKALIKVLRQKGLVVVIDGYNLAWVMWPGDNSERKRENLIASLSRLAAQTKCEMTVVFDGSDVEGPTATRHLGVRVVFSTGGEKADPLVVRTISNLSHTVPVIAVTSDREVRQNSNSAGATVIRSETLAELLHHGA